MTSAPPTYRDYSIIRKPLLTEKYESDSFLEAGKYAFEVSVDATKSEISDAIERLYDTDVTKVNVINVKGKIKRFKGRLGRQVRRRKAIVTLAKGKTLDVMTLSAGEGA